MLKHTISILYYQSVLKAVFGSYKTVAAFSIVIGFFLFMLLPEKFKETLQEVACCRKRGRILN